jgi:hypothetical protein
VNRATRLGALVGTITLFAACTPKAPPPSLELRQSADSAATSSVLAAAARDGIRQPIAFPDQSYRVTDGATIVGVLVLGRGMVTRSDGNETAACFVGFSKADTNVVMRTVGHGEWEAETCVGIRSVGVVADDGRGSRAPIAIMHDAASPNATSVEPVVVSWDRKSQRFELDTALSRRASTAGATTLDAVRNAVNDKR